MRWLAILLLACNIPATFTPTPVVKWDYDQYQIDHRGVDGFRLYEDGVMVADIPCIIRAVDTFDSLGNPISVELYECPGVLVQVPLQRYIDLPAATEAYISVTAYNSGGESDQSVPLTVCWPQTISFDTTGETGRNW